MNEEASMQLLKALLDREGVEWTEDGGFLRFRMRRGAILWETACRACDGAMLVYGRFPFACADPDRARRACDEINRTLVRGALYLTEDAFPVYRCAAETDDVFGAEERLMEALRRSAQAVTHFWERLSGF